MGKTLSFKLLNLILMGCKGGSNKATQIQHPYAGQPKCDTALSMRDNIG